MTDKSLVVQHNKIIEAKYRLSVGEQRLIKLLVSLIEPEDEDFKTYDISVKDLISLLGLSDKDFYGKVKVWSRKLIGNVLVFKDGDGDDCDELQVSWLSSATYHKKQGTVSLRFDPALKPFLLHLKSHFTAYELGNVIRLKHTYSIRIYELLKQYEKIGRRKFTVENLRELLMLEENEYKQFCDFRRWVLKTAQKELSEKTDIAFTWEEERVRQKCIAVEFVIKSQKRPQGARPENEPLRPEPGENKPKNETVERMVNFGVTRKTAENLFDEYGGERIRAAFSYTEDQQKKGKLDNPAGFLVEAIKNEYRDHQAEERERQEKALREAKAREERRRRWENLKNAYAEAKEATFRVWRSTLNERDIEDYRKAHMATLNTSTREIIKKHKERGMVEKMFLGYLKSLLPFPSLGDWAKQSGLDVAELEEEIRREEAQASAQKPTSPEIAA
jgi:plasmid replication initiation protein